MINYTGQGQIMNNLIYLGFKGKMTKVNEPRLPNNANFVIQYKGMDWSGFRSLSECEKQFSELEQKNNIDDYSVVEK